MAVTYPEKMIWEALDRPFEYEAFERLKRDLPVEFVVVHSVEYLDEHKPGRHGECDFVVMHPELGMLFMEVKGGTRLEAEGGHWRQWGKDGTPHDCDNPFDQARSAMHALTAKLKIYLKTQHIPFTFGYAVYLPGVEFAAGNLPPSVDRRILIDARDNGRIHESIRTAMEFWQGNFKAPTFNPTSLVEGFFMPSCRFVRTKQLELGASKERMIELTREQSDLLNLIAGANKRVMVQGAAGTGKTLLAEMLVDKALEQGRTVLFACFNRLLGRSLESRHKGNPDCLAGHFHSICYRMAEQAGMSWPKDMAAWDDKRKQTFWDDESAMLLVEALTKLQRTFDLIVIDEGQDLNQMQLGALLSAGKGTKETQLVFFYDPGQNIYERQFIENGGFTVFPLTVNCRNVGDIAKVVNEAGHTDTRVGLPGVAGNVVTHVVKDDREHDKVLSSLLSQLVDREHFRPEDIVVLVPSKDKQHFTDHPDIGKFKMVWLEDYQEGGNRVAWTTVKRFKGLERDVVVFCMMRGDKQDLERLKYVGYSRAKLLLHVITINGQ